MIDIIREAFKNLPRDTSGNLIIKKNQEERIKKFLHMDLPADMMRLRFDLYKEGGKWAYGGEFDLPKTVMPWDDDLLQKIDDAQNEVIKGTIIKRGYHCVINEVCGVPNNNFQMRMFSAEDNEWNDNIDIKYVDDMAVITGRTHRDPLEFVSDIEKAIIKENRQRECPIAKVLVDYKSYHQKETDNRFIRYNFKDNRIDILSSTIITGLP